MPLYSTENLGPTEFRAVSTLIEAHPKEHGRKLRAMLAFGPIIATGQTRDLQILEVVEGWQGPRRASFSNAPDFPLKGRLTLYFLTPDEFEQPTNDLLEDTNITIRQLMYEVEKAYAVLYEEPHDYAFDIMQRFDTQSGKAQLMALLGASPVS